MGYYILGTIIFLLLIVFISDLLRNSQDNRGEEIDNDEFYNQLSNQYPGTFAYKEEFSEENLEDDLETEDNDLENADSDEEKLSR